MKLLDLFSGTGSVSSVARRLGYDVRTLDLDPKSGAHYALDVLEFDYKKELARWIPDVVWSSPPCTHYSRANTRGSRDIRHANRITRKTLEIIAWVRSRNKNVRWVLENPQTGSLKDQPFMRSLPYVDADYCRYGFPYRKRTRFWTNQTHLKTKLCQGPGECKQMNGGSHVRSVGSGRAKYGPVMTPREKYPIPPQLVKELILPPFRSARETSPSPRRRRRSGRCSR